jgi:hypothetical protein
MRNISAAHIASASLAVLLAVPAVTAQTELPAIAPPSVTAQPEAPTIAPPTLSKARIVRLSEVKGEVQMDRGVGSGFEPAVANLPVVENCRLLTGNGVAEVEFEDNSSLRLGPNSVVEFPALERMPSGATVSSVRVLKGMAYVSLMKTPANQFNLLFGQQSLPLPASSHVRLQLEDGDAKLTVLDGGLQIKGPEGIEDVPHKRTITFALAGSSQPTVAKSVDSNPFDEWDRNAEQYHARQATASALNSTPYAYGLSDMSYYGDFADLGGCGMMWRPYFASAAWNPYSNGAWAWYGGAGYSWVSPYPWGWTPYHYGAWSFCQGAGWGWMPGGGWMGLNNTATFASVKGPIVMPKAPIRSPRMGGPGLLMVNQTPLVRSQVNSSSSFLFRKDSAGMGIPRDELGKLNKFSEHAMTHGTATTPVFMQAPVSAGANGRANYGRVPSMRRGSPPEAEGHRSEMGGGESRSSSGYGGRSSSGPPPSSGRAPSPAPSSAPSGPSSSGSSGSPGRGH